MQGSTVKKRYFKTSGVLLFFNLLILVLCAQERPPIEIYTPDQYLAQNQNWNIAQIQNRNMCFANNAGLLEYDGTHFSLYQLPNKTAIRTLKVIDDNIYTGGFMDFGYWNRSETGQLEYTSIKDELKIELLEDEEFWGIEEIDGLILFQSYNRIYVVNYESKSTKIIESDSEITKMVKYDQTIYIQKKGLGLYKIENEELISHPGNNIFGNNRLIGIVSFRGKPHYISDKAGIYEESVDGLVPSSLNTRIDSENISIYSVIKLRNGGLALGTISNGLLVLDEMGNKQSQFNGNNGLSNNTVLSIFEDIQGNIWLGLDNGINCLNMTSQFRVYENDDGYLGTVYTSVIFEDLLYLGTNQGLFSKPWESDEPFRLVEETSGQVWNLKNINGTLFCGHNSGTFIIESGAVKTFIPEAQGTWDFKPIPDNPDLIIQGHYNGLNILENQNGEWRYRNKLKGFDISSRFFEIEDDQIIVNHEFKGLYSLIPDISLNEIKSFSRIPITLGTGSNVLRFSNNLIYTSTEGIYSKSGELTFKRDSILSKPIESFNSLTTLFPVNGDENLLWCYADENILFLEPGNVSGAPIAEIVPLSSKLRNVVTGFANISRLGEGEFLLGTSTGYLIFNRDEEFDTSIPEVRIGQVKANELDLAPEFVQLNESPKLNSRMNNLEFSLSIPFYQSTIQSEYQVFLEGFNKQWTDWSHRANYTFENLRPGDYNFHVKGRIGKVETPITASYGFVILPPWYLSYTAKVAYVVLFLIIIYVVNRQYQRYYKKQQLKLIEQNRKELELKELENEQMVMRLNTEALEQSIENKNRELAISTMSLIKKNEFLRTIQSELSKSGGESEIKRVIKVIDRNLNNTDDWKFFEEAFNNADKDFLKKVKNLHPKLTSNDLRLCAYLRLNLSSKEIAPLLNISARSVEVKRYRLRKKMNLPHETNLTNYILEI